MKKLIISIILASMLFGFVPLAHAEGIQPTQQELTQQLIVLITQLINQLQKQLNEIIIQQSNNNQIVVSTPTEPVIISTVVPVEVPFDTFDNFIFVSISETSNSFIPYANNIHDGDVVTLTINGHNIVNKFQNTIKGKADGWNDGYYGDMYGSYRYSTIENLSPNTEYSYILRIERGNQYAIKTGVFKTLPNYN